MTSELSTDAPSATCFVHATTSSAHLNVCVSVPFRDRERLDRRRGDADERHFLHVGAVRIPRLQPELLELILDVFDGEVLALRARGASLEFVRGQHLDVLEDLLPIDLRHRGERKLGRRGGLLRWRRSLTLGRAGGDANQQDRGEAQSFHARNCTASGEPTLFARARLSSSKWAGPAHSRSPEPLNGATELTLCYGR